MKKSFSPVHILFILLTLMLAACGTPEEVDSSMVTQPPAATRAKDNAGQPEPGISDMAIVSEILLDPANATDSDSLFVLEYMYEGLVKLDANEFAPVLAESWTVSDDGLDYIFTLRRNITFHDGTPLNADAVIANFNRWFDKEDPAHGTGEYTVWATIFGGFKGESGEDGKPKSNFDGAEKVDDYTVLIHLAQPDGNFLAKLVNPAFRIVSPAAFSADNYGTSLGTAAGTGPYQLTIWGDSGLTLSPFAAYWNGTPTDTLEFPFK